MLTIILSQSGLLLCKFINAHLFLGGERRLGQPATYAPGTAQHPRTHFSLATASNTASASTSPDDQFRVPTPLSHPTINSGFRRVRFFC
jgi:hypothetical protein